ncbi:hypothetical protein CHCC14820_0682 [Bacillus paralicheniformis]|nr:hypothetical protein B4123_2845 [Bacillus paralicheniformis]TWJ61377.1 hypothetical protein CHCC5023_3140 [Bacillus paralicheniformis]TWJ83058.1 hypothetical protein CHCC5019_1560 [Bacillus paralicheniformis]TWM39668.1 hypothetical protein CHCC14820_0682 [Bacillus paralicheniformis]TWN99368.1 hypothetical protein CHCC20490_2612 [Bacillus paralicheniformis]
MTGICFITCTQTSPLFKACLYHKRKAALSHVIIASRT